MGWGGVKQGRQIKMEADTDSSTATDTVTAVNADTETERPWTPTRRATEKKTRAPGQRRHGPSHIEQSRAHIMLTMLTLGALPGPAGPCRAPKSRRAPGILPPLPPLSAGLPTRRQSRTRTWPQTLTRQRTLSRRTRIPTRTSTRTQTRTLT